MKKVVMIEKLEGGIDPIIHNGLIRLYLPEKLTLTHDTVVEIDTKIKLHFNDGVCCMMVIPSRDNALLMKNTIVSSDERIRLTMHTFESCVKLKKGALIAYVVPILTDSLVYKNINLELKK